MTLQSIPGAGVVCVPAVMGCGAGAATPIVDSTLSLLDAADEALGMMFPLTKAGTLTKIHFYVNTYTAGPETVLVRLESIDSAGSHGLPSGNLFVANANGTVAVSAANTWYAASLNGGSGVTIADTDLGTYVAAVVKMPNPLVNAGSFRLAYGQAEPNFVRGASSVASWRSLYTGSWASPASPSKLFVRLEYSDGTFANIPTSIPFDGAGTLVSYDSADTPDEYGAKMRFPFTARAVGVWMLQLDNLEDIRVFVREGDSTKKGWTAGYKEISEETTYRGSYKSEFHIYFETPFTITANQWYRISVTNTHATNTIRIVHLPLATAAHWACVGMSQTDYQYCYQTDDSGSWTDENGKYFACGFILDQLDDGAGGGGGGVRNPFGGPV